VGISLLLPQKYLGVFLEFRGDGDVYFGGFLMVIGAIFCEIVAFLA